MKEINAQAAILGKNAREKQKSIGEIVSELSIIKEQLRHPNVVRYGNEALLQSALNNARLAETSK